MLPWINNPTEVTHSPVVEKNKNPETTVFTPPKYIQAFQEIIVTKTPVVLLPAQKDIYIFFHICCINNYQEVCNEMLEELMESGLYEQCKKIFFTFSGRYDNDLMHRIKSYSKSEILYYNRDVSEVEYPMLENISRFCNSHNAYICYIHTKGVSHPNDNYRQNWRKRLVEKTISEWKICVQLLNENCDLAGCGWKDKIGKAEEKYNRGRYSHFSGNFWWANSLYIRTLPDMLKIRMQYQPIKEINFLDYRIQCEMWVGMSKKIKIGVNGELNKEYSTKLYYQKSE